MTTSRSLPAERTDLVLALGAFVERPTPSLEPVAEALGLALPTAAAYTDLFVQQLPPYASIYLGPEGGIGGDARGSIAGFWRAVGTTPPPEPDHLASLLGLWAGLAGAGGSDPLVSHAVQALVWEHLASWLVPYLTRVREIADDSYVRWADVLLALVAGTPTGPVTDALPAHFQQPASPPDSPDDFVPFVLSPVRSGLVLTRMDLTRAGSELGLGMRIGERAYALQAMLDQDAPAVTAWLSDEAVRQASVLAASAGPATIVAWWTARLTESATFLDEGYRRTS